VSFTENSRTDLILARFSVTLDASEARPYDAGSTDARERGQMKDGMIDISDLSLEDIEAGDQSVLSEALRRAVVERDDPRDQTAFHRDHTDSHGSSPW
jgi:FXSXX-COOH protein